MLAQLPQSLVYVMIINHLRRAVAVAVRQGCYGYRLHREINTSLRMGQLQPKLRSRQGWATKWTPAHKQLSKKNPSINNSSSADLLSSNGAFHCICLRRLTSLRIQSLNWARVSCSTKSQRGLKLRNAARVNLFSVDRPGLAGLASS